MSPSPSWPSCSAGPSPRLELRKSIRSSEPAENLGLHEPRTSLGEIQRILERAASRENRRELYETLATRAGLELEPRACWMLYRLADRPGCSLESVGASLKVEPDRLEAAVDSLVAVGMVARNGSGPDRELVLTDSGKSALDRLAAARRDSMTDLLEGWDPETHPEVVAMIRNLAKALLADDDKLLADARSEARPAVV